MTDPQLVGYLRWRATLPDVSDLGADEAWAEFRAAHDEACAVCRRAGVPLVVDHCHVTGWVRGLLCRSCNAKADSGGPNVPLTNRWTCPAITAYCQLTPADVAGLRRVYEPSFWGSPHELLDRAIWFAGAEGLQTGGEISDLELVEIMRTRDWGEG